MKKIFFFLFIYLLCQWTVAQEAPRTATPAPAGKSILPNDYHPNLKQLLQRGVETQGGKTSYSDEVIRLLTDLRYRDTVYGLSVTLENARQLWSQHAYSRAMYMYVLVSETNMDAVLADLQATNIKPDIIKAGICNTCWTYAMFDPRVISLPQGKVHIDNPAALESISAQANALINAFSVVSQP